MDAQCGGHETFVVKWVTNGNIPIIRHCSQEEAFSGQEHADKGILKEATMIGDGLLTCYVVHQHFRNKDGGIAEIQESQMAKEKVFGTVELGTSQNYYDNPHVAHHSCEIDQEKQHKKNSVQFRVVSQPQEDKFSYHTDVSGSHLCDCPYERSAGNKREKKKTKLYSLNTAGIYEFNLLGTLENCMILITTTTTATTATTKTPQ